MTRHSSLDGWPSAAARASAGLLAAVWLLELSNLASPSRLLSALVMAGLLAFVLLALLRASVHIRVLFAGVGGLAASIAAMKSEPALLVAGLERALVFGAFLPSVLLLRATVENSPRIASLREGVEALDGQARENWMVCGSHALGSVLNVGTMGILAPVLGRDTSASDRVALAAASVRGVGTAVMWSPFFVSLGFVSHLVPSVKLWEVMALGAGLALAGLALSGRMFTPNLGVAGFLASTGRLLPLVVPTVVIVGTILAVATALSLSGPAAVAAGVPLLCAAYLAFAGRARAARVARDTLRSFGRLADEMIIIVGATVLGTVIARIPEAAAIAGTLTPSFLSGASLIITLMLLLIAGGLAGLHPMIGATILLPILAGGAFGVRDVVLVETAVFAWGLSATVSIWTLPVAVASSMFGVPLRALATGRPLRFAALYVVVAAAYLSIANAWMAG